MRPEGAKVVLKKEVSVANRSLLELMMRYSINLYDSAQTALNNLYLDLFVVLDFKKKLGVEFLRNLDFAINWESITAPDTKTKYALYLDIAF